MIKVNELRVGNLVNGNCDISGNIDRFEEKTSMFKVVTINADPYEKHRVMFEQQNGCLFEENMYGIALTIENMLMLGAKQLKDTSGQPTHGCSVGSFIVWQDDDFWRLAIGNNYLGRINFVHELQNVYFALEKKELIFKPC